MEHGSSGFLSVLYITWGALENHTKTWTVSFEDQTLRGAGTSLRKSYLQIASCPWCPRLMQAGAWRWRCFGWCQHGCLEKTAGRIQLHVSGSLLCYLIFTVLADFSEHLLWPALTLLWLYKHHKNVINVLVLFTAGTTVVVCCLSSCFGLVLSQEMGFRKDSFSPRFRSIGLSAQRDQLFSDSQSHTAVIQLSHLFLTADRRNRARWKWSSELFSVERRETQVCCSSCFLLTTATVWSKSDSVFKFKPHWHISQK